MLDKVKVLTFVSLFSVFHVFGMDQSSHFRGDESSPKNSYGSDFEEVKLDLGDFWNNGETVFLPDDGQQLSGPDADALSLINNLPCCCGFAGVDQAELSHHLKDCETFHKNYESFLQTFLAVDSSIVDPALNIATEVADAEESPRVETPISLKNKELCNDKIARWLKRKRRTDQKTAQKNKKTKRDSSSNTKTQKQDLLFMLADLAEKIDQTANTCEETQVHDDQRAASSDDESRMPYQQDKDTCQSNCDEYCFADGLQNVDQAHDLTVTAAHMIKNCKPCYCGFTSFDGLILVSHFSQCEEFQKNQMCFLQPILAQVNPTEAKFTSMAMSDSVAINSADITQEPQQKAKRKKSKSYVQKKASAKRTRIDARTIYHKQCACGLVFENGTQLAEHVKADHKVEIQNRTLYVCPKCSIKPKRDLISLLDHFSIRHTKEEIKYTCDHCSEFFSSYSELQQHQQKHKKKFNTTRHPLKSYQKRESKRLFIYTKCACGKKFGKSKRLAKHVKRRHSTEKNNNTFYICPVTGCNKKPSRDLFFTIRHYQIAHVSKGLQA